MGIALCEEDDKAEEQQRERCPEAGKYGSGCVGCECNPDNEY